jgi:hypothetical protein
MDRACSMDGGEDKRIYDIGGKTRRKVPLGKPRCRWVDNIKMDLGEVEWGGMDWIGLAQDIGKKRKVHIRE